MTVERSGTLAMWMRFKTAKSGDGVTGRYPRGRIVDHIEFSISAEEL